MRRKSSQAADSNNIELPLLREEARQNGTPLPKSKSHFIEFFNPDTPPLKYIKQISFIKLITFLDIWIFASSANKKPDPLQSDDLPLPFDFYNVEQKILALDAEWTKEQSKPKPSIVLAILRSYKKEASLIALIGFFYVNARLGSTLLMGSIIDSVTQGNFGQEMDRNNMFLTAGVMAVIMGFAVLLDAWYWHLAACSAVRIRNTIIGFAYKKLQSVALSSLQEINIGKVINLLSNDINDIDKGLMYVLPVVLSPYTIGVGGLLIWNFFDFTTIFGIGGLVAFLALSNYVSKKTESIRSEKNTITDERIKLTNELIECIRLIKMYAWEKTFKHAIEVLREREVVKVIKIKILDALGASISFTSSQSCLVIMCVIFTLSGGVLTPQKIYTTLMILNFVRVWGTAFFHFGVMFIANSRVMKTRIEDVLSIKDVLSLEETIRRNSFRKTSEIIGQEGTSAKFVPESTEVRGQVAFNNFSAWWKKEDPKPCLNNINLTLYPGQITTVIGTIGCGKSSFLMSFLREIPSIKGQLMFTGKVAYVEQEPIIFSGTVRSNILFGQDYDDVLYKKVVRACSLRDDFKQFDDADMTKVGERGITLSGGQKARISLARALYSKSDIYLFDDPLSAVDSKVGRHIFENAIKGDLLKDKVVVLVTHHLTYAKEADRVLLFSEGAIIGDGPFESLKSSTSNLFTIFKETEDTEEKVKTVRKASMAHRGSSEYDLRPEDKVDEKKTEETKDENNQVTWTTYFTYIKQSGNYFFLLIILAIYFTYISITILFIRLMGYWAQMQYSFEFYRAQNPDTTNDQEVFDHTFYVFSSIALVLIIIFCEVTRTIFTYQFLLNANSKMHNTMLQRIVRATILFFDTTPIGTVLNRFSNDIGVLDGANPPIMSDVVDGTIHLMLMMGTLITINISLIGPCLIVIFVLYKIKKFFQKPVMETKRLDLASRSPLYSEISATINGLLAIRVYRQGGNFIRKFCDLLYDNSRAFLYMERTVRFFAFTMNVTLDSLSIVGTFIFIYVAYETNLEAGIFGLAIVMLQEIAGYGAWVVRMSLLMDINMQSVERITKYYELAPEPPTNIPDQDNQLMTSANPWPQSGQITFNNVYMKYRPEFDYVLQQLSFSIPGGCKLGIVGRTGAGKSSIIQILFRMVDIEYIPGSSIQIDGINISRIGLDLLRKSIAIIPQTPVIFTGKIRRNLDPFDEFSDAELWQALEEVNLKTYVQSLEKKLDTDMTMSNSVFSAGQKQLVCLARAILKRSKIIMLDEATANVDIETDDFIQKKIMERFRDCTVITIAHRLITIANYDKVLVMDKGRVAEYDSPYMLMVERQRDKQITRQDGVFAQMVQKSGESMSRKIFEIAYNKFSGK